MKLEISARCITSTLAAHANIHAYAHTNSRTPKPRGMKTWVGAIHVRNATLFPPGQMGYHCYRCVCVCVWMGGFVCVLEGCACGCGLCGSMFV